MALLRLPKKPPFASYHSWRGRLAIQTLALNKTASLSDIPSPGVLAERKLLSQEHRGQSNDSDGYNGRLTRKRQTCVGKLEIAWKRVRIREEIPDRELLHPVSCNLFDSTNLAIKTLFARSRSLLYS
jgi:hypothetical protein